MTETTTFICQAILFDMDGTLLDSSAIIERAWKWWTARHHLPLEPIMRAQQGRPNIEVLMQFGPHLDIAKEAELFLDFELNDTGEVVAYPGALEAVKAAHNGAWAVVTSANKNLAEVRLRAAGFPVPQVLVGADDILRGKPDPECYLLAAEKLGVEPQNCIVFEDAPAGVAAGIAAGMIVIAVLTLSKKSELPAYAHIKDFRDVKIAPNSNRSFEVSLNSNA